MCVSRLRLLPTPPDRSTKTVAPNTASCGLGFHLADIRRLKKCLDRSRIVSKCLDRSNFYCGLAKPELTHRNLLRS